MTQMEIGAVKFRQALLAAFPNGKTERRTSAVITAAGSGERMGGVSKPLYLLNGVPCILYSLKAFQDCEKIQEIVVVAREEEMDTIRELAAKEGITKLSAIVPGGSTRQVSVQYGFCAIDRKADLVAIHDAARPLILPEDIERILKDAARHGAATAATAVTDTVKRGDERGMITENIPRDDLYQVQTPQIFYADLYRVSLAMAQKDGISVTDDCSLAEHAGFRVKLTTIRHDNLKLTLPEDGERIERILRERDDD